MSYLKRWIKKIKKIDKDTRFFSYIKNIFIYIVNDMINIFLIKITRKKTNFIAIKNKKILFIEPQNQGFGDLLFQTPIFKVLGEESVLDIFCLEKHRCIIDGLSCFKKIYTKEYNLDFNKYDVIFYLGRSTIRENLIALKCRNAEKVILDLDVKKWGEVFKHNPHMLAWQIILNKKIGNRTYVPVFLPDKYMYQNIKTNTIVIIGGTENSNKKIDNIYNLILSILKLTESKETKIFLVGKSNIVGSFPEDSRVLNFINQKSYEDSIFILMNSDLVIGPEGSLIHVSTTLGIPTIIIENGRNFYDYSIIKNKNISILDNTNINAIKNIINLITSD